MNRKDFQDLARLRLKEAQALLKSQHYDGAYYLGGYIIECALKACIAKQTQRGDFPDKKKANECYTHDLEKLIGVAGLRVALDIEKKTDPAFAAYWTVVKDWSEESRYLKTGAAPLAQNFLNAVADARHGVLRWIKLHW